MISDSSTPVELVIGVHVFITVQVLTGASSEPVLLIMVPDHPLGEFDSVSTSVAATIMTTQRVTMGVIIMAMLLVIIGIGIGK